MTCADELSDTTLLAADAWEDIGDYARERFATLGDMDSFIKGIFDDENSGDQDALNAIASHFTTYDPSSNAYGAGDKSNVGSGHRDSKTP